MTRVVATKAFLSQHKDSEPHNHNEGDRSEAYPYLSTSSHVARCFCACCGDCNNILLDAVIVLALVDREAGLFVIGDKIS